MNGYFSNKVIPGGFVQLEHDEIIKKGYLIFLSEGWFKVGAISIGEKYHIQRHFTIIKKTDQLELLI